MKRKGFYLVLVWTLLWNCTSKQSSLDQNIYNQWLKFRTEKDSLFKYADWSPLTLQDRQTFDSLEYFPYDPSWRMILTLHRYPVPQSVTIQGTKEGDLRPAEKIGYFEFQKDGKKCRLEVIKILPSAPQEQAHLFLGFWDQTSGKETYPGGRYVDLEALDGNRFVVDFNYAYNPYCAYSHRYSCAIPPLENQLPVAVKAGEKAFKKQAKSNEKEN